MSTTIRYAVGSWWGVVSNGAVVLLPETVGDADLTEVQRVLFEGGGVAQVIQVLAGGWSRSLTELPSFGIALVREGEAHAAVRGQVTLVIEGEEPVRVDGRRASTWSEHVAESVSALEMVVDQGPMTLKPRWLPVRDAVVPISGVRVQVGTERSTEQRGDDPIPVGEMSSLATQSVTLLHRDDPHEDQPLNEEASRGRDIESDPVPETVSADEGGDDEGGVEDGVPEHGSPEEDDRPALPGDQPGTESAPEQSLINLDHVWDATSLRSVEDAAVRVQDEEERDGPPSRTGDLVSGVPTFTTTGDVSGAPEGDHDGHTVVSAKDLSALRAGPDHRSSESGAGAAAGPMVLSARCSLGHDNPPHAATCATCDQRVAEAPRRAPRPSLGTVQLPDGTLVTLDRSVVFGRRPQATRVHKGDLPQLVTLNGSSISRTHVEVRLEDWNVLAVDLGSSNGTYLNRTGQEPVRLTAHDPLPLRSGDVLDLGDDVTLTLGGVP